HGDALRVRGADGGIRRVLLADAHMYLPALACVLWTTRREFVQNLFTRRRGDAERNEIAQRPQSTQRSRCSRRSRRQSGRGRECLDRGLGKPPVAAKSLCAPCDLCANLNLRASAPPREQMPKVSRLRSTPTARAGARRDRGRAMA